MTLAEDEVRRLIPKCNEIAEVLQKGLEVAGRIVDYAGPIEAEKVPEPGDLLGNLQALVSAISCKAGTLLDQLNRIQNQL